MVHKKFAKKSKSRASKKRGSKNRQLALHDGNADKSASMNGRGGTFWGLSKVWQGSAAPPIPRGIANRVYNIRQLVGNYNTSNGINGLGTFPYFQPAVGATSYPDIGFQFADLDQVATFAAAFDQYKIDEVEMILTPSSSVADMHLAVAPNQINPQCVAVMDFDDSVQLTTLPNARQYDNAIVATGTQGMHFRMKPGITPADYAAGAFAGYIVEGSTWIDCNSQAVPHYGVKFAVQGLTAASTAFWQWNIETWYHLSLRSVR